MNSHDILAYAVAREIVGQVALRAPDWSPILDASTYITSSRAWPVPDFVLVDPSSRVTVAAEFKPPQQTKREYLTGLGQASAYTRDFHHGLLIVPFIADDGYRIADHINAVLNQNHFSAAPLGIIAYNPSTLSPSNAQFVILRPLAVRTSAPVSPALLDNSFYAKWRELSPQEIGLLLSYAYDEMRTLSPSTSTIRDRAFDKLWQDIQNGTVHHWGGDVRNYKNTAENKVAVSKNYRNFLFHIGWCESTGSLTKEGLEALHSSTLYGSNSEPFFDSIALALLTAGKHLILLNAISEFQDSAGIINDESIWLSQLEIFLEDKGLLKRNPARHAAATANSARQFLKAEKQLWRNLRLIVPRGGRVFHPGRGFIFDWARITSLLER
jgi:hypothetical protein